MTRVTRTPPSSIVEIKAPHPISPEVLGECIGFMLASPALRGEVFVLARLMMSRNVTLGRDTRYPYEFWRGVWFTLLWTLTDKRQYDAMLCLKGSILDELR